MHDILPLLAADTFPALQRARLDTLQVNLTYQCNQRCLHCHVNAGPTRQERLSDDTLACLLEVIERLPLTTLDLTGGAPELHPRFRPLVRHARRQGLRVIDRCNLTILSEPGQEDLGAFLAAEGVEVVASLPCYSADNVDRQRGEGVFGRSIDGLRQLNALGYGQPGSGLTLNLVYNPQGPHLPPPQAPLEAEYRQRLQQDFGIVFSHLLTLTNQPIARFGSTLVSRGEFAGYLQLLQDNFRADNLASVMCRTQVSVDWQGYLYDCDFNQMLGLALPPLIARQRPHLRDLLQGTLEQHPIATRAHCYACTAGQGSSCGGALATA